MKLETTKELKKELDKKKLTDKMVMELTRQDVPDLPLHLWMEIKMLQKKKAELEKKLPKLLPVLKKNRPKKFMTDLEEVFKYEPVLKNSGVE